MQIGRDVHTDDGQVILNEGVILNEKLINGLVFWDVVTVYIREERLEQAVPTAISESPVTISKVQQKFFDKYDGSVAKLRSSFEMIANSKKVPIDGMEELTAATIFPMLEAVGAMNHLHMVHRQDDYTFHHSVNVSVICGVLGKWLGYAGGQLNDLVMAGLLHDIGKTQIPPEILNKPGKLTEMEMKVMQTHPTLGYNLIRSSSGISPNIGYGILQHHERLDGSGYPFALKDSQIHKFARIIAIADIYDAMTSDRAYKNKVTPFTVVETMTEEMFDKLDAFICTVFLNNVRDYFVGNLIRLSDGRTAEVVYLGPVVGTRPTVKTNDGVFIDLEQRKDIGIIDLVKA
jgi:HD-GYP domain-containing protein (c-di-GMP phosphodiesterase class II)